MKTTKKVLTLNLFLLLLIFFSSYKSSGYRAGKNLRIHHIQSSSHFSKYNRKYVKNVQGIITAIITRNKKQLGFYMQDKNPDNNPATSEGIFVLTRYSKVKTGDLVKVTGKVTEYSRNRYDLPLTEIKARYVNVVSSKGKLPEAVLIGPSGRKIPSIIIDKKNIGFNPKRNAIDFYESMEGMLVEIKNPVVIAPPKKYGRNFYVLAEYGINKKNRTKAGGVYITKQTYNPERIVISTDLTKQWLGYLKTGDRFNTTVKGILSYEDGMYKILAIHKLSKRIRGNTNRQKSRLRPTKRNLIVATYNVKNLSAGKAKQINGIAKDVVYSLRNPDIIALQEIQDDNGTKGGRHNNKTNASKTFEKLILAIRKNRGANYAYIEIEPEANSSGGIPGGNIRTAFLYRTNRVKFDKNFKSKGNVDIIKTSRGIKLSSNPGRIKPYSKVFNKCRKPLVCEFIFRGRKIFIINLHLIARSADTPLFGKKQPPLLRTRIERQKQASAVSNFIKKLLSKNPNANVIVLGDFNEFPFAKPVKTFEKAGLVNIAVKPGFSKMYTFIYQGNSQIIDQFLVSRALLRRFRGIDAVHINSDFPERYRNSDHDPLVASFSF